MIIKAMKQALENLENWQKACIDCDISIDELEKSTQSIEALRQAIKVENALRELTTIHYEMQSKGE
jgi:hypothetical protein